MTPFLKELLIDPITGKPLRLQDAKYDSENVISGTLVSEDGTKYPIINGIPRFIKKDDSSSVTSFGDEWNYFNFTDFKQHWLEHTVKNTFGSVEVFKDQIVLDAGGGSGSQTKWFLEYGAKHVILMDLSHSVDDVVKRNLSDYKNVDVIQCSIDKPPLLKNSISGIVYCHNVIQHTPSVEDTAKALWSLVGEGGEFVFNCYPLNDQGILRYIRHHFIYMKIRWFLSKMPFKVILFYSTIGAILRQVPILGYFLEKTLIVIQGDVPKIDNETFIQKIKRRYKSARLNTFDAYGSHSHQHNKSDAEILGLAVSMQSDQSKIKNMDKYFSRPRPAGTALRLFR